MVGGSRQVGYSSTLPLLQFDMRGVAALQVAYLAITGWLDDRKEKEDRKTYESSIAQR